MALLVQRDLKVRYRRSVLGMGWTLLNPLLQMGVYTLVFSTIMRVGVPRFPLFLLAGLLPWTLLAVSTTSAAHALLANQGLIRKVAVPQAVYPLALVASKWVDLLLSLGPLALLAWALGRPPGLPWLALVPALLLAGAFAAGLALLVSSVTVFYRDVRHLVELAVQVWFYVTPVLYPRAALDALGHPALRALLALNPAAPVVRLFQVPVYEGRWPGARELAAAALAAGLALVVGGAVFLRREPDHIHYF